MFKKKRSNRSSDIINWFYNSNYGSDTDDRIKKKFTLWIANEENNEEKDEVLEKLYAAEKGTPDAAARKSAVEKILNEIEKRGGFAETKVATPVRKKTPALARVTMRVAAVMIPLLIIGGIWMMINRPDKTYTTQWGTHYGQTETVALPDSSSVMINAGSELRVRQDGDKRYANLDGEAYFKVAKDKKRPFVVQTKDLTVTVLGTQFNVEAYPDNRFTIVTLAEGKISLALEDGKEYTLMPNQRLVFDRQLKTVDIQMLKSTDSATAWMSGRMVCELMTLEEIFKGVERKYNVKIEVEPGVQLNEIRYTAQFDANETPESIFRVLKIMTEKFDFSIEDKTIKITKPQADK